MAIQGAFLNKEEQLFPYGVYGKFTDEPYFEKQDNTWYVTWKIPTQCQYAEVVYFDATKNKTGGVTGSCITEEGQICRVEIDTLIFDPGTEYKVQAKNSFCLETDDYFTSDVFTLNMNALSSGPAL